MDPLLQHWCESGWLDAYLASVARNLQLWAQAQSCTSRSALHDRLLDPRHVSLKVERKLVEVARGYPYHDALLNLLPVL